MDRWVPLANVAEVPRYRYEVDLAETLQAHEALEADGFYPWIVVHSHLVGGTAPSHTDIEYARNRRQLHLIIDLGNGRSHMTLWRLDPDREHPASAVRVRHLVVDQDVQAIPPTDLTRGVSGG